MTRIKNIARCYIRQEDLIEFRKKIQRDRECNFPDQTNYRNLQNMGFGSQKEDDRKKIQLNT